MDFTLKGFLIIGFSRMSLISSRWSQLVLRLKTLSCLILLSVLFAIPSSAEDILVGDGLRQIASKVRGVYNEGDVLFLQNDGAKKETVGIRIDLVSGRKSVKIRNTNQKLLPGSTVSYAFSLSAKDLRKRSIRKLLLPGSFYRFTVTPPKAKRKNSPIVLFEYRKLTPQAGGPNPPPTENPVTTTTTTLPQTTTTSLPSVTTTTQPPSTTTTTLPSVTTTTQPPSTTTSTLPPSTTTTVTTSTTLPPTTTTTQPVNNATCNTGITISSLFITTPTNQFPNFGANPTKVAFSSGNWSSAAIWRTPAGNPTTVPGAGDVVSIPANSNVVYDVASTSPLNTVSVAGLLAFRPDINTSLYVQNLLVLPCGELMVGSASAPVAPSVKAEIVFPDLPLNSTMDPEQYGNGLIALGKVTMHGAVRSDSFVRLATEPQAGQTSLSLAQPVVGWQVNDRIVLPDSEQYTFTGNGYAPLKYEEATISSIAPNGLTVYLAAALSYRHPGARNASGVLEFLPHVGNRTRNVVVRSASVGGVRGHTYFTQRANIDIRYASFAGLGRTTISAINNTTFDSSGNVSHLGTNQNGRFPIHFAHLYGPAVQQSNGYQYTFVGNTVFCPMMSNPFKWGVALEDSHYGLIEDNFLYNWAGAGLIATDGGETRNVIADNFAMRGIGSGDRDGNNSGFGFWFRGPNNFVRDNVAANFINPTRESAYGLKYYMVYADQIRVPKFQGANTSVAGEYTIKNGYDMPILEFARNETYGMENGMSYWWVNTFGSGYPRNSGPSVIKDFRAWNFYLYGIYSYESKDLTIDGFVARSGNNGSAVGITQQDYYSHTHTLANLDIQGVTEGVKVTTETGGTTMTIRDSAFTGNRTDIRFSTPWTSAYTCIYLHPRRLDVRNVTFTAASGIPHTAIDMFYAPGISNLIQEDSLYVYNYNGTSENFQVYYNEQAANFIVPQSTYNSWDNTPVLLASPVSGQTNQQNWSQNGIAIAGAVAPSSVVTKPEIHGLLRPF